MSQLRAESAPPPAAADVPASAKDIERVLGKGDESIGLILDGIAGMFMSSSRQEVGCVMQRKAIVKIALRQGTPLVPVYCFGHTELWTVVADPFGILRALSVRLNVSLSPFFGRFGWPRAPLPSATSTQVTRPPPQKACNTTDHLNHHLFTDHCGDTGVMATMAGQSTSLTSSACSSVAHSTGSAWNGSTHRGRITGD